MALLLSTDVKRRREEEGSSSANAEMLKCRNAETRRELQAFRVDSPNLTCPASAYHSLHILVGVGKPPIFINRGACTPPFADRANLISEYGEYSVESIERDKSKATEYDGQ